VAFRFCPAAAPLALPAAAFGLGFVARGFARSLPLLAAGPARGLAGDLCSVSGMFFWLRN